MSTTDNKNPPRPPPSEQWQTIHHSLVKMYIAQHTDLTHMHRALTQVYETRHRDREEQIQKKQALEEDAETKAAAATTASSNNKRRSRRQSAVVAANAMASADIENDDAGKGVGVGVGVGALPVHKQKALDALNGEKLRFIREKLDESLRLRKEPNYSSVQSLFLHEFARLEQLCSCIEQFDDSNSKRKQQEGKVGKNNSDNTVNSVTAPHRKNIFRVKTLSEDMYSKLQNHMFAEQQRKYMQAWGKLYHQSQQQAVAAVCQQQFHGYMPINVNAIPKPQMQSQQQHSAARRLKIAHAKDASTPISTSNPSTTVKVPTCANSIKERETFSTSKNNALNSDLNVNISRRSSGTRRQTSSGQAEKSFPQNIARSNRKKLDKNVTKLLKNGQDVKNKNESGDSTAEDDGEGKNVALDPTTAPLQLLPSNNQFLPTSAYERIYNPMLTLPTFESHMYAAEVWNVLQLYLPDSHNMSTFPLSYLIRLLGCYNVEKLAMLLGDKNTEEIVKNFSDKVKIKLLLDSIRVSNENDAWYGIPQLGIFRDNVLKKHYEKEGLGTSITHVEGMNNVDPLYLKLLYTYDGNPNMLGYDTANIKGKVVTLKPAPQRNFASANDGVVNKSFFEYAKSLNRKEYNTIFDTFIFRLASSDDELAIIDILKCNHDKTPKHILEHYNEAKVANITKTNTKNISDFVVLACKKTNGEAIGFIHYQFNWYRSVFSSATSNASTGGSNPIVANVVFNIVHMSIKSKYIAHDTGEQNEKCNESMSSYPQGTFHIVPEETKLFLTLCATEHARSLYLNYGLVDIYDDVEKSWFEKYFRCATCYGGNRDFKERSVIPIVFDLSKVSYRYSLLQRNRCEVGKVRSTCNLVETHTRFLCKLPNKRDVSLMLESGPDVLRYRSNEVDSGTKNEAILSKNGDSSIRMKNIEVIVWKDDNGVVPKMKTEVRNRSLAKQIAPGAGVDTQLKDYTVLSSKYVNLLPYDELPAIKCPTWDVIRSFDVAIVENNVGGLTTKEEDNLLLELTEKQTKLIKLESKLQPFIDDIFCSLMYERHHHELNFCANIKSTEKIYRDYDLLLQRKRINAEKLQAQIEADMDAVCSICLDGNITSENQILFCESCNVAVHQQCYGIGNVPSGDWYCEACKHFKRDIIKHEQTKSNCSIITPGIRQSFKPPIVCELCPVKGGAFVQVQDENLEKARRWVHVVCAKWNGLYYVQSKALDGKEVIESVDDLKIEFMRSEIKCDICKGRRGSYTKCRVPGCKRHMHVMCARMSGLCNVFHGDNSNGQINARDAWSLSCMYHSTSESQDTEEGKQQKVDKLSVEELIKLSASFPPEPIPEPPRPSCDEFHSLDQQQRKKWMEDDEFENTMLRMFSRRVSGAFCHVCNLQVTDFKEVLLRCAQCLSTVHPECYNGTSAGLEEAKKQSQRGRYYCDACSYVKKMETAGEKYESPRCNMCNMKGGLLKKAFALPGSKKLKKDPAKFAKTLFRRQIWCHALCGLWHPGCTFHIQSDSNLREEANLDNKSSSSSPLKLDENFDDLYSNSIDCTNVIMSSGMSHVYSNVLCALCGRGDRVKMGCHKKNCAHKGNSSIIYEFHLTCARQAGLEVTDVEANGNLDFTVSCFRHSSCNSVLRARLEDFLEIERDRLAKKGLDKDSLGAGTLSLAPACKLFHTAVSILAIFGWAWRWAEWWVELGDNWEPLLEQGQKEEDFTKEELKIVDSTKESRCADARKCRLAALGAALRNRNFDKETTDNRKILNNALQSVFSIPSLVGPLSTVERDFIVTWLGRAYRSKSPLLGFGPDATLVADSGRAVIHIDDSSNKFELGTRPLPGKGIIKAGQVFESAHIRSMDKDNFLKEDVLNIYHNMKIPGPSKIKCYATKPLRSTKGQKVSRKSMKKVIETEKESIDKKSRKRAPKEISVSFDESKDIPKEKKKRIRNGDEPKKKITKVSPNSKSSKLKKRGSGRPARKAVIQNEQSNKSARRARKRDPIPSSFGKVKAERNQGKRKSRVSRNTKVNDDQKMTMPLNLIEGMPVDLDSISIPRKSDDAKQKKQLVDASVAAGVVGGGSTMGEIHKSTRSVSKSLGKPHEQKRKSRGATKTIKLSKRKSKLSSGKNAQDNTDSLNASKGRSTYETKKETFNTNGISSSERLNLNSNDEELIRSTLKTSAEEDTFKENVTTLANEDSIPSQTQESCHENQASDITDSKNSIINEDKPRNAAHFCDHEIVDGKNALESRFPTLLKGAQSQDGDKVAITTFDQDSNRLDDKGDDGVDNAKTMAMDLNKFDPHKSVNDSFVGNDCLENAETLFTGQSLREKRRREGSKKSVESDSLSRSEVFEGKQRSEATPAAATKSTDNDLISKPKERLSSGKISDEGRYHKTQSRSNKLGVSLDDINAIERKQGDSVITPHKKRRGMPKGGWPSMKRKREEKGRIDTAN